MSLIFSTCDTFFIWTHFVNCKTFFKCDLNFQFIQFLSLTYSSNSDTYIFKCDPFFNSDTFIQAWPIFRLWPIISTATHFLWPIFTTVTHFSKCYTFLSVTHFLRVKHFSVWLIFLTVTFFVSPTHFSNCDLFFQLWHIFKCDPFF